MLEGIIFGIIQGITEWIPVSSDGALILAQVYLVPSSSLVEMIELALFLHLGTFFAALVYLREDVKKLFRSALHFSSASQEQKKTLEFLFWTTVISGVLGFVFFSSLEEGIAERIEVSGRGITAIVGVMLLLTAIAQFAGKKGIQKEKEAKDLKTFDTMLGGAVQGFATLPGLSRSGLTVAALLVRGFKDHEALRLSFLMSLPIVLAANIFLGFTNFALSTTAIVGAIVSFLVGLLSIHALFALARRVNFSYFVFLFGVITIIAAFV